MPRKDDPRVQVEACAAASTAEAASVFSRGEGALIYAIRASFIARAFQAGSAAEAVRADVRRLRVEKTCIAIAGLYNLIGRAPAK